MGAGRGSPSGERSVAVRVLLTNQVPLRVSPVINQIIERMGLSVIDETAAITEADLVIDAIIGYSLQVLAGEPRRSLRSAPVSLVLSLDARKVWIDHGLDARRLCHR